MVDAIPIRNPWPWVFPPPMAYEELAELALDCWIEENPSATAEQIAQIYWDVLPRAREAVKETPDELAIRDQFMAS